jgi:tetratricopeptide (TPR) repeat protein
VAPALERYGLSDIVALRTLARLKAAKVSSRRIAAILDKLRQRLHEVKNPLSELKLQPDGRRIRVQFGSLTMEAESGQLLLDFADEQVRRLVELPRGLGGAAAKERKRRDAENWFQRGVELEQEGGPLEQILDAYRVALALDPELTAAMVNLGTLYFGSRELDLAEKYYQRAVETNPKYALAHFNLGNLYDECGDRSRALHHYQAALKLDAHYADAHYNLALLHQGAGEVMKAARHWRTYLRLDPLSSWAEVARRELKKIYQSAVVVGFRKN